MRQWVKKIFGDNLSLREKLFRIIINMGIAAMVMAIISNIALKQSFTILFILLMGLVVLFIALGINFKYNKMDLPALLLAITIDWIMFPMIYFTSGGIESGATVWFVLGIIFVFLLFSGKMLFIVLGITLSIFSATYIYGYIHPEAITPMASERDIAFDSAFAVMLVAIAIGILIKFQSLVYEQERKEKEAQKKKLEEINLSKSTFFANMSHEIRTPINTIIGLNEMTLRENISDEVVENSINIQNASKMLLSLINDILDLSKIESGKMELVPTQYETSTLFSELINIIWIRAHEKNLEFKLDVDKNIPSMLYGDEVRLRQILINVLTNAVKYTKKGSVTLSASCEKTGLNEVELKVVVSDTGIGIRKESMNELFSSFKRVDQNNTKNIEGTGLGLSISKQLLDLMGGKIKVDSIYTKGSTFTITVKQQIVNEAPIGQIESVVKKKIYNRDKYKQSFEAPDAKILVVDDTEMNLLVATKLLRSTKVKIDTASSGEAALELTKNNNYHVIFMDHKMSEMDGIEALNRIRNQENGRCLKTPVVALTANVMSNAQQIYSDYGFDGYLAKPINGSLFEATLLKYLPEELIEYSAEEQEQDLHIQMIKQKKKKPVYITADCVCDLPKQYIKEYDIGIIPYYVVTKEGQFRDIDEISADSLLDYLKTDGNFAHSHAASEEEYESFFADALEKGEQVIHLTIAQNIRKGSHAAATAAMRGFNHVTVYDSGHLSSGMGILVLIAAKMAAEHKSVDEIINTIDQAKKRVSTSFIVPSIQSLHQNGLVGNSVSKMCNSLDLHPVLHMSKSYMKCNAVEIGDVRNAYHKYIRRTLQNKKTIDTRVVFITYSGCNWKQLHEFRGEIAKHIQFENVIFQQASATVSCNCGLGAMGILFMYRK